MTSDNKRKHGDDGLTIVELTVGIVLMGMLTWALSTALVVVLRQGDNTAGRLNNARSELAVDVWMPTDLASASTVNIDANGSPCGTTCPASANVSGSNALMLSWEGVTDDGGSGTVATFTTVSYRYVQSGDEWQMIRVECVKVGVTGASTCSTRVVVHNLEGPPPDVVWIPGTTVPSWVIEVAIPLDPADPGNTGTTMAPDPNAKLKGAQRVIVTINGGGDAGGAGGGINQINLSAGGTTRATIPANSTTGVPNFTAARSRCGGNVVLIVDESASIGDTNIGKVRTAVEGFIDKFSGTPVMLEIVRFDAKSSVLQATGETAAWSRYYDMLIPTDVSKLRGAVTQLRSYGGTNWEEAFYRTFKTEAGVATQTVPGLVVFFTDGIPTRSRVHDDDGNASNGSPWNSGSGPILGTGTTTYPPARMNDFPTAAGNVYNQEAFDRANLLVKGYREEVTIVGVGVGDAIDTVNTEDQSDFIKTNSPPGWHYGWEYRVSGNWTTATQAQYNNASSGNRRRTSTQYFTPPYERGVMTTNQNILGWIVKGVDQTAEIAADDYSNYLTADLYLENNFDTLGAALAQIALKECGGTLTLQTRTSSGPAPDPFTYQNTDVRSTSGTSVLAQTTKVTTTGSSKSGTFDFEFTSGQFVTVDVMPEVLSDLTPWSHEGWSCTSGPDNRPVVLIDDPLSDWVGFTVKVYANEAVSCVQTVSR